MSQIGVGIIGFGFMGRTHLEAYLKAIEGGADCQVRGIFSLDPPGSTGQGNVDTGASDDVDLESLGVRWAASIDDILQADDIDAVSICTPTDTHIDLAMEALNAGKHVLLEKPVALTAAEVDRLIEVDEHSDRLCMPAMCMRFWPGWSWLRETVASGRLGSVTSAFFHRIGAAPGWSQDFYLDETRSGGALTDLHVHDVDFIHATFGLPDTVSTSGTRSQMVTRYQYRDGPPSVVAEAAWYPDRSYPFQMRYRVSFDAAVADFDLAREGSELILYRGGESEVVKLPGGNGYDGEIGHFIGSIAAGQSHIDPDLHQARAVVHLLECEGASIDQGLPITP